MTVALSGFDLSRDLVIDGDPFKTHRDRLKPVN
jgi:hypothetical protein